MAICAHCKTEETQMYERDVPICLACATDKAAKITREERPSTYSTTDRIGGDLPKD